MSTREFANKIVRDIAILKSYSLWKDAGFRKTVSFVHLTPKKQDIIFNELEAASVSYLLFFLEDRAKKANGQDRVIYSNIAEYVVDSFLSIMVGTEMEAKILEEWRVLLNKRIRTYRTDMSFVINESSDWPIFKGQDKLLRETWGRILTLSLNTTKQISGQTVVPLENPLWKELRKYLTSLEVELVQTFKEEDLSDLRVLN